MATVAETEIASGPEETAVAAPIRRPMPWWTIALLTSAYLASFMDRQILSLLVEPIKADLHLTDTTLGMIQGVAFGIVFTVAGIPMGWLADRVARPRLIACALVVWSGLTAACAFAGTASQLMVARMGVGLGEAALGPSAAPLIRESVPRDRVVTAMAIYMLGIPLGGGMALFLGGVVLPWVQAMGGIALPLVGLLKPWQATMVLVSLPGFILALLMLTVSEPRHATNPHSARDRSIGTALGYMGRHWRAFLGFGLPGTAAMILTFGVGFWIPAGLARTYHLSQPEVAGYMRIWGLMTIVLGTIGTLACGAMTDRIRRARPDGYVLVAAGGVALLAVSSGLGLMMPSPALALLMLAPSALCIALAPTAAMAGAMEIIPAPMRSLVFAVWMLAVSLIGMSAGPPLIGFLTTHVFHAEAAVRWSILTTAVVGAGLAVPLLLAIRGPYLRAAEAARQFDTRLP